jgi:hypothetical protein
MKLEELTDILEIDESKLKSPDKSNVIRRVKQLLKAENKSEVLAEDEAEDFPYEAVSIVGNTYVAIKFDIESKKARVVETHTHPTDTRGKNYMVGAEAIKKMQKLIKEQK